MTRYSGFKSFGLEIARLLLAFIFILSGFSKITNFAGTENYMASKGMVGIPFFLVLAIIIEVVGGLSIVFGYRGKIFGFIMALYLVPVTLIFHNFWAQAGMEYQSQMVNFLKNLCIMGGLLQYAYFESLREPYKAADNVTPENTILRREPITT
jgi:putative oxidoreductase